MNVLRALVRSAREKSTQEVHTATALAPAAIPAVLAASTAAADSLDAGEALPFFSFRAPPEPVVAPSQSLLSSVAGWIGNNGVPIAVVASAAVFGGLAVLAYSRWRQGEAQEQQPPPLQLTNLPVSEVVVEHRPRSHRVLAMSSDDAHCSACTCGGHLKTGVCVICMDAPNQVIFDCGHLCTCTSCSADLRVCPYCRSPISSMVYIQEVK